MHKIINYVTKKEILTLPSMYYYYNYSTGKEELIVDFQNDVAYVDYSLLDDYNSSKAIDAQNINIQPPNKCSILKLKNNNIVLFIPYTKLIPIIS